MDQARDVLSLPCCRRVRNFVDLQPVNAALIREDEQERMGGRNDKVLHHIFRARTHADAALAAACLARIGVNRSAFYIATA